MTFAFVPTDEVARVRARIDHPVIDADGHLLEFLPLVNDIVREVAGNDVADRYQRFMRRALAPDDAGFMPARVFWGLPEEHTLDRMTVTLPKLTYRRADEIGPRLPAALPELRPHRARGARTTRCARPSSRALNTYYAEMYADYRDRLEPVAVIPTFTPEEAVDELDHAVGHARAEGGGDERRDPPLDATRRHRRRVGRHARPRQHRTTTTRCGRAASSSGWRPPSTASGTAGAAGSRRRTTCTTTWATSPPPRRRPAARC